MSGQKISLLRQKLGVATFPVIAGAALVAGTLTTLAWNSPSYIAADVQPLILDFGKSQAKPQNDDLSSPANSTAVETSGESPVSSQVPIRSESSNGGLVLEWPKSQPQSKKNSSTTDTETTDTKSEARRVLREAEEYLQTGDLRRALISARLAYSYPVTWQADELAPEELLRQLETLTSDPAVIASNRKAVIEKINSANSDDGPESESSPQSDLTFSDSSRPASVIDSSQQRSSGIGIWQPAPATPHSFTNNIESATYNESDAAPPLVEVETVSAAEFAQPSFGNSPVSQPYQSQPSSFAAGDEPGRLDINTQQQASEPAAGFPGQISPSPIERVDQRPLIITDQRAVTGQAESPVRSLTFDVLATLTTIFAVLFFGTLFLFLAVLGIGKKLIGKKGISFKIELVNNSPLAVVAGAAAPEVAPQPAPEPATNELKLDPDFEGILSMSEHRARERESAILQQFIENNVSLHSEINENRGAA